MYQNDEAKVWGIGQTGSQFFLTKFLSESNSGINLFVEYQLRRRVQILTGIVVQDRWRNTESLGIKNERTKMLNNFFPTGGAVKPAQDRPESLHNLSRHRSVQGPAISSVAGTIWISKRTFGCENVALLIRRHRNFCLVQMDRKVARVELRSLKK